MLLEDKAWICLSSTALSLFGKGALHTAQSKHFPSCIMIIYMAVSLHPKGTGPQLLILVLPGISPGTIM